MGEKKVPVSGSRSLTGSEPAHAFASPGVSVAEIDNRPYSPVNDVFPDSGRSVLRGYILLLLSLNVLSAVLFIFSFHRPFFDEPLLMPDVSRYATQGISVQTIREHINAPGPPSFIWMAESIRLFGGNALTDARFAVLAAWLLLTCGVLLGARLTSTPELWYCGLLAALTFPHAMTASALAITEGPALLFAVAGALLWTASITSATMTYRSMGLCGTGGILVGVAVISRQYYMALLPSMCLFLIFFLWYNKPGHLWRRIAAGVISLALAAVPVSLLAAIWGGLSSPGMATGASYAGTSLAVGLNLGRPVIAAFYTALYLLPLTFPVMGLLSRTQSLVIAILGLAGGALMLPFQKAIEQPGPLNTLLNAIRRVPGPVESVFFVLLTALLIFNLLAFTWLLWRRRATILSEPATVFSGIVVVLFIGEQIGVNGNPFYDRYILQIVPFLGVMAFAVLRQLSFARLSGLAVLYAISHAMLWRYAFNPNP